jgi:LmbE family N-acetylglucosaminyl deacetylase
MRALALDGLNGKVDRILCLGAHPDDIEIGCSGTVLRLLELYPSLSVSWVVLGASEERAQEALSSVAALLGPLPRPSVIIKSFQDGFLPYQGAEVKRFFEELKQDTSPDVVFTHYRHDLHQDHGLVSELTWNTFRDHVILEYEIPKYDGDLGAPNVFMPLSDAICRRKIDNILASFPSQAGKRWFEEGLFRALMRLRGMEANAPSGYAEAFYGRKLVLG